MISGVPPVAAEIEPRRHLRTTISEEAFLRSFANGVFHTKAEVLYAVQELQYRIKSADEVHERVASEHELQVAELEKPIVAAGSRLSSADVDAARIFAGLIPLATEPPVGPQGRSAVIKL